MKKILFLITVILLANQIEIKSQSIKGKYRFTTDSDGKEASAKSPSHSKRWNKERKVAALLFKTEVLFFHLKC